MRLHTPLFDSPLFFFLFFFFHNPAPTEIYTLSLHDALPICELAALCHFLHRRNDGFGLRVAEAGLSQSLRDFQRVDRKSTRLNSSHVEISYAVFCLKKKKKNNK